MIAALVVWAIVATALAGVGLGVLLAHRYTMPAIHADGTVMPTALPGGLRHPDLPAVIHDDLDFEARAIQELTASAEDQIREGLRTELGLEGHELEEAMREVRESFSWSDD